MEENKQTAAPQEPKKEAQKNTAMAVVAYILFFVPLLTDAKHDPFVKYHVKQGLVVFLIGIAVAVLSPFIWMISWILQLGLLVLVVLGIVNALNGKQEPLPVVGGLAEKFKF